MKNLILIFVIALTAMSHSYAQNNKLKAKRDSVTQTDTAKASGDNMPVMKPDTAHTMPVLKPEKNIDNMPVVPLKDTAVAKPKK